jgi:hypothetical protein
MQEEWANGERETKTSCTKTFLIPSSNSFLNLGIRKLFADCFTCASGSIWQLPLIFYIYLAASIKSGPGGKKQKDRPRNAAEGRPGLQTSDSSYRLNARQKSPFLQVSKFSVLECLNIVCFILRYRVIATPVTPRAHSIRHHHHVILQYVCDIINEINWRCSSRQAFNLLAPEFDI